jgi:glycosyltransferase involved in cell wall biosynthesis
LTRNDVTLCMISRGEPGLARAISSCLPLVSEVVIVCDPGDREAVRIQLALLAEKGCGADLRVISRAWDGNFSLQRQASFDAARTPYAFWLDSDDSLVGAEKLLDVINATPDLQGDEQFMLEYDYAPKITQVRERLVPRALGAWSDSSGDPLEIHELWLQSASRGDARLIPIPAQVAYVKHHVEEESPADRAAKRARNRKALEAHIRRRVAAGREADRRLVSHYIDQLLGDNEPGKAVAWAMRLAPEEPHGWCRQRLYMQAAQGNLMMGNLSAAHSCALLSLGEQVRSADARVALIEICAAQGRWDEAWYWYRDTYEQGLPLLGDPIGHNRALLRPQPELAMRVLLGMNAFEDALEYAHRAGNQEAVKKLTEEIRNLKAAEAAAVMMDLQDFEAARPRGADRAARRAFCQSLPRAVQDYPEVARWLLPDLPASRPTVAIYCGGDGGMTSTWGPASLGQGIGGSEEAVLRLAPELVRAGAHVECYGPWPVDEIRDGVHYIYHAKWDPDRALDLFVAWRYESFASLAPRCRRRVLWAHDQLPPGLKLRNLDEVWCLSKSHAALTQANYPDARIWVTRNGLPPLADLVGGAQRPDPQPGKKVGRVIWASSPDRGLDILLDLWPQVRAAIPGATLEVYYGFPASYMRAEQSRPQLRRLRERIEAQLAALKSQGVSYFGMVGADRLHRAFAEAEVWAYPTHWPETSCITAMKAQALGCYPVTVPLTALAETVVWGRFLTLGGQDMQAEWNDEDRAVYVAALIEALKTPWADRGWTPDLATRFGWDGVAREWLEHLKGDANVDPAGPENLAAPVDADGRGPRGDGAGRASGGGADGCVGGGAAPALVECDRGGAPGSD